MDGTVSGQVVLGYIRRLDEFLFKEGTYDQGSVLISSVLFLFKINYTHSNILARAHTHAPTFV